MFFHCFICLLEEFLVNQNLSHINNRSTELASSEMHCFYKLFVSDIVGTYKINGNEHEYGNVGYKYAFFKL